MNTFKRIEIRSNNTNTSFALKNYKMILFIFVGFYIALFTLLILSSSSTNKTFFAITLGILSLLFFSLVFILLKIIQNQNQINKDKTHPTSPITDDNKNDHAVLLKENNKLNKKNHDISLLTHVLVHDLKNPIGSSLTYLSLFAIKPNKQKEYLEIIKGNLENCIKIMDLLKTLLAFEEGKLKIKLKSLDLESAIKKSYSMLKVRFEEKELKFNLNCKGNPQVLVEEDTFINSVMNNLLSNAIKFSNPGSSIEITSKFDDYGIHLSVRDYGIGIPKGLAKEIFDATKATTRIGTSGEKGTGFGMPLVKKFIESYNGKIEVESKSQSDFPNDHGTSFHIYLKLDNSKN